jgi:hypothetical protein
MDLANRRARFGVLGNRIGKDAGASHDRMPGNPTGYPLYKFALRPVNVTIWACHSLRPSLLLFYSLTRAPIRTRLRRRPALILRILRK